MPEQVDLSKALVMWVIYKNPKDFLKGDQGDLYVARRRWVAGGGEQFVAAKETCATSDLDECRRLVIDEAQRVHKIAPICMPRHQSDDPVIVETWL